MNEVTISREEYESLLEDRDFLEALKNGLTIGMDTTMLVKRLERQNDCLYAEEGRRRLV